MTGKQLWQTSCGIGSGRMRWGSAASPILVGDLLIVNASDEAQAIIGLDKQTGKIVWKAEGDGHAVRHVRDLSGTPREERYRYWHRGARGQAGRVGNAHPLRNRHYLGGRHRDVLRVTAPGQQSANLLS
jgi:outer membrane protein assembly factor BamB